jgi:hypothetical protein
LEIAVVSSSNDVGALAESPTETITSLYAYERIHINLPLVSATYDCVSSSFPILVLRLAFQSRQAGAGIFDRRQVFVGIFPDIKESLVLLSRSSSSACLLERRGVLALKTT